MSIHLRIKFRMTRMRCKPAEVNTFVSPGTAKIRQMPVLRSGKRRMK